MVVFRRAGVVSVVPVVLFCPPFCTVPIIQDAFHFLLVFEFQGLGRPCEGILLFCALLFHAIQCRILRPEPDADGVNSLFILADQLFEVQGVSVPLARLGAGVEAFEIYFLLQDDAAHFVEVIGPVYGIVLQELQDIVVVDFEDLHVHGGQANGLEGEAEAIGMGHDHTVASQSDLWFDRFEAQVVKSLLADTSVFRVAQPLPCGEAERTVQAVFRVYAHAVAFDQVAQCALIALQGEQAVEDLVGEQRVGELAEYVLLFPLHDLGIQQGEIAQGGDG